MNPFRLSAIIMLFTLSLYGCTAPEVTIEAAPEASAPAPAPAPAEPAPLEHAVDPATLALNLDPICKMSFDEYAVSTSAEHDGKTYGFCSDFCKKKFLEDPARMIARVTEPPADAAGEP